ncbi:MAG TPA: M36 family metallopeptidase [Pyrinomonadaceae bacterium]
MKPHRILRTTLVCLVIASISLSNISVGFAQITVSTNTGSTTQTITQQTTQASMPKEFDLRGPDGVPKGIGVRAPLPTQLAALKSLEQTVGSRVTVQYNGLTATPRHLFSRGNYLSAPSAAAPEIIARDFISRWRDIFRFSDADLRNLRLKSRATVPDIGTTILLFEQTLGGVAVYSGTVLVNVNRAGQVMSVGGESFPRLKIANAESILPEQSLTDAFTVTTEQAIKNAATEVGAPNFAPQRAGTQKVLTTFGDLPREFVDASKYSGGGTFTDDILVTKTLFPVGDTARLAYKFTLTTPQHNGIMWENIVDGQTGKVLRRISLTSFQTGGGTGTGRRGTFRPDIQDIVEAQNTSGTAQGKVTDTAPTALSGYRGFGRSTAPGNAPTYGAESAGASARLSGRGFKQSQVTARNENPLIYNTGFGQVLRGFPDALNPSPASPFGWFYLPTNTGGSEITASNADRATTRDHGYSMSAEAKTRNLPANSPGGDGDQPFAADLTPLTSSVALADGRLLSSVFQSKYTEGNNVMVADDRANDNEGSHGIKGYSANRKFTSSYFDYIMGYEYGGINAGGTPFYPASADPDVYPGAVTLFYYTNIMHDYLYSIGFTESLWNFQQDNFGNGGAGGDGLSAQVQDGSGTNNANMGTNADGTAPRMQMYLFTEDVFRRSDGDFDFDVVAHEYYHGVSNRSAAKGSSGCLGVAFFGESGGQGEGWSDTIAQSMTDDDSTGEFVTGEHDKGIRTIPVTNFRWSYGAIDGRKLNRRDQQLADPVGAPGVGVGIPPVTPAYQVHHVGTIFSAMTWDMRELLIMKQKVGGDYPGVFFDGTRRLGSGTPFYIGERLVQSVDTKHPIDYRETFGTHAIVTPTPNTTTVPPSLGTIPSVVPTVNASEHIVRPGLVAGEFATRGDRNGALSTAVRNGARLADTLVLRGLQLAPCNPSIIDTRDSILLADKELTGGENRAVIWRAFASHGVGKLAASSHSGAVTDPASSMAPVIVEDFTVPASVLACEQQGPLSAPSFTLSNPTANAVRIQIAPVSGAAKYVVSRSENASGPFVLVAETTATTVDDNGGGQGLENGKTYYYQVRASRDAESNCVSSSVTQSIEITLGTVIVPAPLFAGVDQIIDPQDGARLIVSWKPATSTNPTANIVYDVYRADTVTQGDGTQEASFTPTEANRIATGINGTSYNDVGLSLGNVYYYIVQARDASNGKKDTNDAGNTVTRFNAPTVPFVTSAPVFARETFESNSANNRFTPMLTESGGNPNQNSPTFQRITGEQFGGFGTNGKMYAPDYSPCHELTPAECATALSGGGPSDYSAVIGPLNNLTPTSIMEFDHSFNQEANFDGGVIEISVGDPSFQGSTPYPNNVTVFDAGNFTIEGRYNAPLDGALEAEQKGSPLQGRLAYTGAKALHHTRISLNDFAPGGTYNPNNLPVYVRFRNTSDVASVPGLDAGWFVDNVVINNLACLVNVASAAAGAVAEASSSYTSRNYSPAGAIDGDRRGIDWENGGGWNDSTRDVWPDELTITLNGARTISEVRVYTLQNDFRNPVEPTPDTPANLYGLIDFDVEAFNPVTQQWVTVGSVRGNDRAMRSVTFVDVTATKVRIRVLNAREHHSRIVEVEALGCS